jgi:protein phosphatase PTC2/3
MNGSKSRSGVSLISPKNAPPGLILPRLSLNLSTTPISFQRGVSLNSIVLPKLAQRSDLHISHSPVPIGLRSPTYSISSPLPRQNAVPPLAASVKSHKPHGAVQLYCANTHRGLVRDHNEDRVMIMLRIPKPHDRKEEKWPPCSFFGLYDGHGGKMCSNFLRDNLHVFITQDINFPSDPHLAIMRGFERAENAFLEFSVKTGDKSGSCAVVLLIVGKKGFVANLGDSRAVISCSGGTECQALSRDHKASDEEEKQRISQAGGEVYCANEKAIYRILPGRLAVSRAFGDIEAKRGEFGGKPGVLIAVPEVVSFAIGKNTDFVALGSDGIFDRLENKDVVDIIWEDAEAGEAVDRLCRGVERVMIESMNRVSYDNITVLAVAFEGFLNGGNKNNM